MPRREASPVVRRHVWLFRGDDEFLRDTYGGRIPLAKVVRTIVHDFVTRAQAKIQQAQDADPVGEEIDLAELAAADDLVAEES